MSNLRRLLWWFGLVGCPYRGHPRLCMCDLEGKASDATHF